MESESGGTKAEEEGEDGSPKTSCELETKEEAKGESSQKAKDWKNMDGEAILLDQDSFAGAPTNRNESDEAKEKAVPHSVAFEEDKEYVDQHLSSNNQCI